MVGSKVPEEDEAWALLMDLKEIVQLVLSPSFTEESIQYMQTKISDHRHSLQAVFPDFRLRPKHHYIEHYPELTKCFGPLVQAGGLPKFSRIENILLVNNTPSFLCRNYECWYSEHLRSFELTSPGSYSVHQLSELNDTVSLTAYKINGHLILTQKRSGLIRDLKN